MRQSRILFAAISLVSSRLLFPSRPTPAQTSPYECGIVDQARDAVTVQPGLGGGVTGAEKGTLQVVCGAPNARTGMKGIFAPEGSVIPNSGLVLKKGKIRDVESNGMLVSEEEMSLPETIDGIIEVDAKYEIGTPLAQVFGLDDAVIEINLTPNRADCAGVRGIARDLAAAGLGKLKPLDEKPVAATTRSPISRKTAAARRRSRSRPNCWPRCSRCEHCGSRQPEFTCQARWISFCHPRT